MAKRPAASPPSPTLPLTGEVQIEFEARFTLKHRPGTLPLAGRDGEGAESHNALKVNTPHQEGVLILDFLGSSKYSGGEGHTDGCP